MSISRKIIIFTLCTSLVLSFFLTPAISRAQDVTFPQLVEILISIGAISPDKVAQARQLAQSYNSMEVVKNAKATISSANLWADASFSFTKDIKQGDNSQDILILQRILNADVNTRVASSGSGSSGSETTSFGTSTRSALLRFQQKYNISETGIVDARTRTLLNNALIAQRINVLPVEAKPTIIVKANGQTGSVSVQPMSMITLSWDTRNVYDCASPYGSKSVSGMQIIANPTSGTYTLTCQSIYGPITGYVFVSTSTSNGFSTGGSYSASWNTPPKSVSNSYVSSNTTPPNSTTTASSSPISATILGSATISTTSTKYLDLSTGLTGYVFVPSSSSLKINDKLTIEAWIKPTAWGGNQIIVVKGKEGNNWDYGFSVKNGILQFNNSRAKVSTQSAVVSLNTWSHVAVVVDESLSQDNVLFYVNGAKVGGGAIAGDCGNNAASSTSGSGTDDIYQNNTSSTDYFSQVFSGSNSFNANYLAPSTDASVPSTQYLPGTFNKYSWLQPSDSPLYIGGYFNSSGTGSIGLKDKFTGFLDNIKIWSIARTDSQVTSDATASSTAIANTAGLSANWDFESGNANDVSGHSNNGALNGSAVVSSSQTITLSGVSSTNSSGVSSYTVNQCVDVTENPGMECDPERSVNFSGKVVAVAKCTGTGRYQIIVAPLSGNSSSGKPNAVVASVTVGNASCPLPGGDSGDGTWYAGDSSKYLAIYTKGGSPEVSVGDCVLGSADGNTDALCDETDPPIDVAGIKNGNVRASASGGGDVVAGGVIRTIGAGSGDCSSGMPILPTDGGGGGHWGFGEHFVSDAGSSYDTTYRGTGSIPVVSNVAGGVVAIYGGIVGAGDEIVHGFGLW